MKITKENIEEEIRTLRYVGEKRKLKTCIDVEDTITRTGNEREEGDLY